MDETPKNAGDGGLSAAGQRASRAGSWGRRNTAGVVIASSIRFDRVSHRYGERLTLDDVSLTVERGEVMCLLGPSGSGKTTLLRIAAGLARPSGGVVSIDRRVVAGDDVFIAPEHRGVGLVFQDFALFPHLPIIANVEFGLTALERVERRPQALRMLDRVGLKHAADLYPHQLSGGEQQRVALARALAPRPGILLMDEPFSGLDARLREDVRTETLRLLRDTRSTVLIVTHDPEEALEISDRITLMRGGRIEQQGTGQELYSHPGSLFAARFFSEVNTIQGIVRDGAVETPLGRVPALDPSGRKIADGSQAQVCIRHSDLRLAEKTASGQRRKADSGRSGEVAAVVLSRRFVGEAELIEIAIAHSDEALLIRQRHGELRPGVRDVVVSVERERAFVFGAGEGAGQG